jgi:hypothetical protein
MCDCYGNVCRPGVCTPPILARFHQELAKHSMLLDRRRPKTTSCGCAVLCGSLQGHHAMWWPQARFPPHPHGLKNKVVISGEFHERCPRGCLEVLAYREWHAMASVTCPGLKRWSRRCTKVAVWPHEPPVPAVECYSCGECIRLNIYLGSRFLCSNSRYMLCFQPQAREPQSREYKEEAQTDHETESLTRMRRIVRLFLSRNGTHDAQVHPQARFSHNRTFNWAWEQLPRFMTHFMYNLKTADTKKRQSPLKSYPVTTP